MEQNSHHDAFDPARFLSAQAGTFDGALKELRRGRKESHWMWFIFPQLDALGSSPMAKHYAIRNRDEARAYLKHPVLGPRLLECCQALLASPEKSASAIMGHPDDVKLGSSMTLFSVVADGATEFRAVLDKYFDGWPDRRTLDLLYGARASDVE